MPAPIRVVVVDDSDFARGMLRSILEEDGGFTVIGEAGNGRDAVRVVRETRPDLVTMDLEMPVMDGLEAIEEIMSAKAVPILVVSGVADAQKAYLAVARGAIDVVGKPGASMIDVEAFLAKARLVAQIPVITHVRVFRSAAPAPPVTPPSRPLPVISRENRGAGNGRIVAIACSTGGPQALAHILARLPADFACPVVIAQHIADGFAAGMADWLGGISALSVRLAEAGDSLRAGVAYLSPSECNMAVTRDGKIALQPRDDRQVYRPSCDTLLSSVARVWGPGGIGVILTGMGSDGVAGIGDIRLAGGITLAQDEGSSIIFGMNAIAIAKGSVHRVLDLDALVLALTELGAARPATGAWT